MANRELERVAVKPPFIKLDSFLKFAGAGETGGQCKELVESGLILVNGEECTARGKKLREGDRVSIADPDYPYEFEVCFNED